MLELAVKHQALDGIVGAGSRLFGQLLHADELFIDDGQRPVGDLYHGDGVAGIAAPLSQGGDVRAHQFPDGQPCRIVRRLSHSQSCREPAYRVEQGNIVCRELAGHGPGHLIIFYGKHRHGTHSHLTGQGDSKRAPHRVRRPATSGILPPADGGGHKGDAGQDSVNASI